MTGPANELNKIAKQKRAERISELAATWQELLDMEESAFRECCKLDSENADKSPEKVEAVRVWWSIVNSVLHMFVRTRAQYDFELKPFPAFPLSRLANISEEISNGNIPKFVKDATKQGRPLWLKEQKHIAFAIFYLEAVGRGEISDKSPNKTVRQAYNVTARAVQKWKKKREEICVGVAHKHLTPEKLTEKMYEYGEIYSVIGRGAPAKN